jgi:small GTP-binding protein
MSKFFKNIGEGLSAIYTQKEKFYLSNGTDIDEFSETIIGDLASFRVVKEILKKSSLSTHQIESIERNAFNLLINKIELDRGTNKMKVGVVGSFSSGKSTFINSLFGQAICPMAVKPTTSSITKFYYNDREKIIMNGREISKDEYWRHSQHIKDDIKDGETHYIEYGHPFEQLNSIILYDTPGFNNSSNENDTQVTVKTLEFVDVIFFIVDISKGTIDMSSIERLKQLNNKRIYCILNKSDLKSQKAVSKIKEEIISKKIFIEVMEYSASKVLEYKDYIGEYVKYFQNRLIPNKKNFNISIRGVASDKKGRVGNKIEYRLYLDNSSFPIDDFYIKAKEQKIRVEKMLSRISESRQFTLKQKLKRDIFDYHKRSISIMQNILKSVDYNSDADRLNLEKEIENFIREKKKDVTRL